MHEFWKIGQRYKQMGHKDVWTVVSSDDTHVIMKSSTQSYTYCVPKNTRHFFMYKMSSSVTVARRDL
jgi:hypothetical protein